ncbi:MAG: hypothetical protein ACKO0M_06640 [Cyanobium sp.]
MSSSHCPGRCSSVLPAVASSLIAVLTLASPGAQRPAAAAPLPYVQAVTNSDVAARAVLARAGRETCLRGKLTRALVNLSNSCEASGTRTPLCSFADEAVVVTPMSLTFMDDTSRQLLQLIHPTAAVPQTSAAQPAPEGASPAEP